MLIDNQVRSMCGYHYHINRNFGRTSVSVYEWQKLKGDVNTDRALAKDRDAIKSNFKYPKEFFSKYKSAEVHTHTRKLPWTKIIPIAATFLIMLSFMVYVINWVMGNRMDRMDQASESIDQIEQEISDFNTDINIIPQAPVVIGTDVFSNPSLFTPKIEGLPLSAPAYKHLIRIQDVPRIDGCMNISMDGGDLCTCNDQRGSRIDVNYETCIAFIERGFFDFTVASSGRTRQSATRRGGATQSPPAVAFPEVSVTPQ